jgi:putative ABC transport system permease protein
MALHGRSTPPALCLSLGLIRACRRIVPAVIRDEWAREWEAEIQHKWSTVNRRQPADWRDRADVVRRSTGALADAAWLRQQFTFDHDVMRDVRYALRMLHRRPLMSALAVLVLSLGIGGTVAVFSVIDTLLLRDLPYRDAERVATLWLTNREHPEERLGVAPGAFVDWRKRSRAFEIIAAVEPFSFDYLNGPEPMTLIGGRVTDGFFEALGVTPVLGRSFLPDEYQPGRSAVAIISYGAWQRYFGGSPSIVGRKVLLDGQSFEMVGVLPRWFHPDLQESVREHEIWAPKVIEKFEYDNRRNRYWSVVGRLSSGVGIDQARAELSTISSQLAREYPNTLGSMTATIVPLRDHLAGPIHDPLRVLFGAVVLVLLLGCANVAGLLLARAADRQREFALRAAIGASSFRLIRQTLVESVVISTLACVTGLAVARTAINAFVVVGSTTVPQLGELALDRRLVVFALATSFLTAIVVGLWPAIRLSRTDARDQLAESAVGTTGSPQRRRFTSVLIVSEVALALVLLITAGLLIRSFQALASVDPGFGNDNVAVLQVFAYGDRYPSDAHRMAFFEQTSQRLRTVPGVTRVGLVSAMPFAAANINIEGGFRVEGRPLQPEAEMPSAFLTVATADYFRAMDIQLRNGRLFSDDDRPNGTLVAVVNDKIAEQFWPGESPIDRRISVNWLGRWRTLQVVGVVDRLRHEALDREARAEVFMPLSQSPFGSMTYVVRTTGDAASLIPALRSQIWEIDSTLPIYDASTVGALVAQTLAPRRFVTNLLSVLAGLAFLLATFGIYGLLVFSTSQRTREIGIRMAVGGKAPDILSLVLGESARLIAAGLFLGLMGSLAAARLLAALLYSTSPTDPLTLGVTTILFASVALLACYVPARRATRMDPLDALRAQ